MSRIKKKMKPLVYLSRRETFSSSHRLHSDTLSDEQNVEVFGKCNNPNGHGHNYVLEVTVKGRVDEATGMVINITDLKGILEEAVLKQLDHKNIDLDVAYFKKGVVSTAENISVFIWHNVHCLLPQDISLHEVKLWETEKNVAIYRGE